MHKLLVLSRKRDRNKLARALVKQGVKVRQDSGGRVIVVDVPRGQEEILDNLPSGVRVADMNEGTKALPRPDQNEKVFLEAIALRNKRSFARRLKTYRPGESPEEKELLAAPHFLDEEPGD